MLIADLTIRYAASGFRGVLDAERRVRSSIGETARQAQRSEGITKRWMERHKTALTAIGVAASGVMAAIIAGSPSLQAALGETYLWFSMLAEEIGQRWAPVFEAVNKILEKLYEWFTKLPDPVKDIIAGVAGLGIAAMIVIPTLALFVWSLGTVYSALIAIPGAAALAKGALATIPMALAVGIGLVLGAVGVWALWKTGVLEAVYNAGDAVYKFAYNAGAKVREFGIAAYGAIWNWADRVGGVFGDLVKKALQWGADLITNFVLGIRNNYMVFFDAVNGLRKTIESALSFDIVANDRMAQRWGSDFMMHFAAGMQAAPSPMSAPVAPVVNVASPTGGGGNVYLTIERGAFNLSGAAAAGVDERKIVGLIQSEIGNALRSRSR